MTDDPFAALGLPARAGLSDEEVRAAWKRIAAATHPDRDDGGDPARFGVAAAAYTALRTSYGRGEALADLGHPRLVRQPARHARRAWWLGRSQGLGRAWGAGLRADARWRRIALHAAAAVGVVAAAVLAAGWTPATVALLAGALIWGATASLPGRSGR